MCSTSTDTIFAHFCTWKSHSIYGKPCPYVDNGLIRSKNSTQYLNLSFHNSFSKLRYIWWDTGTCGNVFVHFHLWKTLFHWPQTPSTHGKVVSLWPPGSFSVTSTASNHGYKIPVSTAMKQSVDWLRLDSFPSVENSSTNPFHIWNGKMEFLWQPDSFSVISTASDRGYKLPVPTTMAQSVHWFHHGKLPSTNQPGSSSRLHDELMLGHYCVSCTGCPFNTESNTRSLCWRSRAATAPTYLSRHIKTRVSQRTLRSSAAPILDTVHQDRLCMQKWCKTCFSLLCADHLELVTSDYN